MKEIRGYLISADQPTPNNRVYPREVLEKAVEEYNQLVEDKKAIGEMKTVKDGNSFVDISKISHRITGLWFEGDELHFKANVLETSSGKILDDLLEANFPCLRCFYPVVASTLGVGRVDDDGVVSDFKITQIGVYEIGEKDEV